jgi:hypothetical protein
MGWTLPTRRLRIGLWAGQKVTKSLFSLRIEGATGQNNRKPGFGFTFDKEEAASRKEKKKLKI